MADVNMGITSMTFKMARKATRRMTNLFCEEKEESRDSSSKHSSGTVGRSNLDENTIAKYFLDV